MLKKLVIWLELFESVVCWHLQNNYHKGTHQEGSIDHFGSWFCWCAIVENSVLRIFLVTKKSGQLTWVSMYHREIEWTKVFIEWEVLQIIVNVEKESIFEILRRFNIRYPVKFIYNQNSLSKLKNQILLTLNYFDWFSENLLLMNWFVAIFTFLVLWKVSRLL